MTNLTDIYHSAAEGWRKGQRDVKLSRKYLKGNQNVLDSSDPFWITLGKDVNRHDAVEQAAYVTVKTNFMDKWAREHPLEMVSAAFERQARQADEQKKLEEDMGPLGRPVVMVADDENILPNLVEAYGDDLTEENIVKFARSSPHEHMTREEECRPLQLLRAALQWKIDNNPI